MSTLTSRQLPQPIRSVRRGKRIVVVALVWRLAGVLYARWSDGVPHDAQQLRPHALSAEVEHKRAGEV